MVLAICLQESRLAYRRQVTRGGEQKGPAVGFAQFEINGVRGVLSHPKTRFHAWSLLEQLGYAGKDVPPYAVQSALEHNDVLCAGLARLNLWWLPWPLPQETDAAFGWQQYEAAWRPGKPKPDTWPRCFEAAWAAVNEGKG